MDSYTITVTATDSGDQKLSTNVSVTFNVSDINDNAPVFPATPTSFSISETLAEGAHVATISATDDDETGTENSEISFNITGGSGAGYFDLDTSSGNLTVAASLDYEMNTSFQLVIEAYDGGSPTMRSNKTFTIRIRNADDNEPEFTQDLYEFSINENNLINDLIGQVEAEDLDPHNRTIGYGFVQEQTDFNIDMDTGEITAAVVFNLEVDDGEYNVEMYTFYQDDEDMESTDTAQVTITINDVNEFDIEVDDIDDIMITENMNISDVVGEVVASDNDANSNLEYTITITGDVLGINSTTGKMYINAEIDRESSDLFADGGDNCPTGTANDVSCLRFNVKITDKTSGDSEREGVNLLVQDEDDEPPVFAKDTYRYSNLSEAEEVEFVLSSLDISASDPDIGVSLTYSIPSDEGIDDFAIQSRIPQIYIAEQLDYERSRSYNFTITATDTKDNIGSTTVVIEIFDENDNTPAFVDAIYTATISEDSEPGLEVITVNATDADSTSNAELTYSISTGNTDDTFEIDPESGLVTLEASINREEVAFYSLSIQAVDGGVTALTGSVLLNISISDIDDHPPSFVRSQFSGTATETDEIGTAVLDSDGNPLQLTVEDLDEGSEVTIITYGFGLPFTVNSTTGNVTVSDELDAETETTYQFFVIAEDNTNLLSQPATVTITINGTNDHTPEFEEDSYEITIAENSQEDEVILEVIAEDQDFDDEVFYSLETSFNGSEVVIPVIASGDLSSGEEASDSVSFPFELNNSTGEVTLVRPLDYETVQQWEFTVTATDKEGLYASVNVTINVENLNDNTPRFDEHIFEINILENSTVSDTIAVSEVIRAQDADLDNQDSLRYILTGGAEGTFEMDHETGDLYLVSELDPTVVNRYELELVVTDGERDDTATAVISVVDINNNGPVFEEDPYSFSLLENATTDSLVGQVVATDGDLGTLGSITYSLTGGDTSLFYINGSTGEIYTNSSSFDADLTPFSYEVSVTARDGAAVSRSATVSVEILLEDVNDNEPRFTSDPFTFEVAEDTDIDLSVFRVEAMDNDSGSNADFEFEILTENSSFSIDLESGIVRVAEELDFDNTSLPNPVIIEILVSDKGNPPMTTNGTMNITITDTNDNAPYFSGALIQAFVAENTTVNATAFTVEAFDRDSGENAALSYEIISAIPTECNSRYRIVASTGDVILNEPVDAEEREESCTLLVRATDNGNPRLSATTTYNVLITNINEKPPEFMPASPEGDVPENSRNGTVVLTLETEDGDGDTVSFQIVNGASGMFDVSSDGVITVANGAMLDRETRDSYSLLIEAQDDGTPQMYSSATVTIVVTDENDNPPIFDESMYHVSVRESLGLNAQFATVHADDDDIGTNDDIEYSLVENGFGDTDFDKFDIAPSTGQLFLTASLDYDTEDHYYLLRVAARDGVFQTNTTVHIRLLESNDITPMFDNLPNSTDLLEDAQNGTVVYNVSATDNDLNINGKITYTLMTSDGSRKFSIDSETGVITVKGDNQFDFDDGEQEYELTVVAMDNAGGMPSGDNEAASGSAFGNDTLLSPDDEVLSNTSTLTIQITDVNDNAPVFTEASYNPVVVEHDGISLTVIRVSATDADEPNTPNSQVKYEILSGAFSRFEIQDDGDIISIPPIDREVLSVYNLVIVAYDQGTPSMSTSINVTITVHDSDDERPVFTQTRYTGSVVENSEEGVSVVEVRAVDRDTIENPLNYSIFDQSGHFTINTTTGVIETSDSLIDREANQNFTLLAQAGDVTGIFSTAEVFVTVIDLNDERPVFQATEYSFNLTENQAVGTRLSGVRAVDADSGSNSVIVYELMLDTGRSGLFEIDSETGEIVVESLPCFSDSATETHTFTLHATDSLDSSLNDTAFLTISLYEENRNPPDFIQPSYVSRLDSLAPTGTEVIPNLRTTDRDVCSGAPIFAIVDGNTNDTFEIDSSSGRIILTRNLTEDDLSFTLTISATDTGNFNVPNRSVNVSLIVQIGQLLPVSVTVDSGLTTLLISRLSQFVYHQDIWLHNGGGSPISRTPNLTYSLGIVTADSEVPVVGAQASSVVAALAHSDVYPDDPQVLIGVQVEGPNSGRASVESTEVYVRIVADYLSTANTVTTASCVTIEGTGSCVVSAGIPPSWFTSGSTTASVYYGLSSSASESLGNVSINTPESCPDPSSPEVRLALPAKVLFPGAVFNTAVYAKAGADIHYFLLNFAMNEGLEFVDILWYPSIYSIQSATYNNTLSVTVSNTEYTPGINSDFDMILELQFRLKSDASIPAGNILSLSCTVEYLVTANGEEVLTSESAVHINYDEDGSCNAGTGKLLVASPTLVKLLPYTDTTGLLNTAYLNGEEVTVDIVPYGFMNSGEFSDSLTGLTCESEDDSILKVESDCSKVYLIGNETNDAENINVEVSAGQYTASLTFQIWFPRDIDITFSVTELSPVQGVYEISDCSETYESTAVTVQAVFTSGDERQVATVTPLVANLLMSSDENVLGLVVDSTSTIVQAVGQGTGEAKVTLEVYDSTITSDAISVMGLSVQVDDINFSLHTGLSPSPLSSATAGESYLETASVTLLNDPEYLNQSIGVLAEAVLSNGRNLRLSDTNGLVLESMNENVIIVTSHQEIAVRGLGSGLLLKGSLETSCTLNTQQEASTLVEVDFQPISQINVNVAETTLATQDHATILGLPTTTSVKSYLIHEDGTSVSITEDERTSYDSTGSQLDISSTGTVSTNNVPGASNISITYAYNDEDYSALQSVEVIGIIRIQISASPYPGYTGSGSVDASTLDRYPVDNEPVYQQALLQVTAWLSDGTSIDISDSSSVSFSVSDTSVLERNGTVVQGMASGTTTVVAELGSLNSSISFNVTDTELNITAITQFSITLDEAVLSVASGTEVVPSLTLEFSDGTLYPSFLSSSGPALSELVQFSSTDSDGLPIDNETGLLEITENSIYPSDQVIAVQLTAQPSITSEITISQVDLVPSYGDIDIAGIDSPPQENDVVEVKIYLNAEGASLGAVELEIRHNVSHLHLNSVAPGDDIPEGSLFQSFNGYAYGQVRVAFVTNEDVEGGERMHVATARFTVIDTGETELSAYVNILNEYSPVLATIGESVPRRSEAASLNFESENSGQAGSAVRCSSPPCSASECEALGVGKPVGDVNADCVFDLIDVLALHYYSAEATIDPDSFTDSQLEAMDADKNRRIDIEDAIFLLGASLGRYTLIADPVLRPIDAEFSNCVLSINVTLEQSTSSNDTFIYFGLFHTEASFGSEYDSTEFSVGTKLTTAIPSDSFGGWSQPMSFGDGVYGIMTEPGDIAQTDISFVLVYGTLGLDGTPQDERTVFLTGPPTQPLTHSSLSATFEVSDAETVTITSSGFNGLIPFNNSFRAEVCYNNHAPVISRDLVTLQYRESTDVGTIILNVTATDADSPLPAGNVAFSIEDLTQQDTLEIDPTSGSISIASALDRESYEEIRASIVVTDQGPHIYTRMTDTFELVLRITDVNDNPPISDQFTYTVNVSEDETGTLFQFTGADGDVDAANRGISSITVSYNGSDIDNIFEVQTETSDSVDTFTASLVLVGTLDFETRVFYNLSLVMTDAGTNPATQSSEAYIELYVMDANDNRPVFTSQDMIGIIENNAVDDPVLQLKADDADSGTNAEFTFEISQVSEADDDGVMIPNRELIDYFYLDPDSGILRTNRSLDREAVHSFTVVIFAREEGITVGIPVHYLWVMVCEQNDNTPTFADVVNGSVHENSPDGTTVTTLQAPDIDEGSFCFRDTDNTNDNIVEYELLSTNVPFFVERETGNVLVNGSLDYEETQSYVVEVLAYDLGSISRSSTANLTISIVDRNDNAPVLNDDLYEVGAFENSTIGRVVTDDISAMDKDSGVNAEIRFSLTGAGNSDFAIDPGSGVVTLAMSLDRDVRQEFYYLTVIAYNPNDPSQNDTALLNITVFDINDNEPVFNQSEYYGTISENAPLGAPILTVLATDADVQIRRITYSLENNPSMFQIDPLTGVVFVNESLCVSMNTEYTFIVIAEDRPVDIVVFRNRTDVTVLVQDENLHAPQFERPEYGGIVAHGVAPGEAILTVSASDSDTCSPPFHYFISNQPLNQPFSIGEYTGVLYTNATLDEDEQDFYTLTISAVDSNTPNPLTSFATVYVVVGETVPVDIEVIGGFPIASSRAASDESIYEQSYDFFYDTYMGSPFPGQFSASYGPFSSRKFFHATPLPATRLLSVIMTPTVYYDNRTVMAAVQAQDEFGSYTLADTEVYMRVDYGSSSRNVTGITTLNRGSTTLLALVLPESWFSGASGTEATVEFGIVGQDAFSSDSLTLVTQPDYEQSCSNFTSDPPIVIQMPAYSLYAGQVFKVPILAGLDITGGIVLSSVSFRCTLDPGLKFLLPPVSEVEDSSFATLFKFENNTSQETLQVSFSRVSVPTASVGIEKLSDLYVEVTTHSASDVLGISCIKYEALNFQTNSDPFSDVLLVDRWGCHNDYRGEVSISRDTLAAVFPSLQQAVVFNDALLSNVRRDFDPQLYGYVLSSTPYPTLVESHADILCSSSVPNALKAESTGRCEVYVDGSETEGAESAIVSFEIGELAEDFDEFEISSTLFPVSLSVQVWYPDLPLTLEARDGTLNAVHDWTRTDEGGTCIQAYQTTTLEATATFRLGNTSSVIMARVEDLLSLQSSDESVATTSAVGIVGLAQGMANITASSNGQILGRTSVAVSSEEVRPVEIELFHGASVETLLPDSIPYKDSSPFQVRLEPGLQYETQSAQLLSNVLFSDGTRYWVSDLVQYSEPTNYSIFDLVDSEVTAVQSGTEWLQVDWSGCSGTVISRSIPLILSLLTPEIRISLEHTQLALPNDAASLLDEFSTTTTLRVTLVYSIDGEEVEIDVTDNSLTSLEFSPENDVRFSLQGGSYLVEPLVPNSIVSVQASYKSYTPGYAVLSIVETLELTLTARPYPTYQSSPSISVLYAIGNTGSFQRAQLEATLIVSIPEGNVTSFDVSTATDTDYIVTFGSVSITGNIIIPSNVGSKKLMAQFGDIESNEITLNVNSQDVTVSSIDRLELSTGDTLSGQENTVAAQLSVGVTFSDGTKFEEAYVSGSQVIPALFTVVITDRNVAGITLLAGDLTILDNAPDITSLTVTMNDRVGLQESLNFYANLEAGEGELDLGSDLQSPVQPVSPGDTFSVPVYVNTGSVEVGAIEVAMVYSSSLLSLKSTDSGSDWTSGTFSNYFASSNNEFEGFVHFGGLFVEPQAGLLHIATLNFIAGDNAGLANIKANIVTYMDSSVPPVPISHPTTSPAANIGVVIGTPTDRTQPDLRIPLENLESDIQPCTDSLPCDCDGGKETGDINGDCVFTMQDVITLYHDQSLYYDVNHEQTLEDNLLSRECHPEINVDFDIDGVCNTFDVIFLLRASFWQAHFVPRLTTIPVNRNDCFLTIEADLVSRGDRPARGEYTSLLFALYDRSSAADQQYEESTGFLGLGSKVETSEVESGSIPGSLNGGVFIASASETTNGRYEVALITDLVSPGLGLSLIQVHSGYARQLSQDGVVLMANSLDIPPTFPEAVNAIIHHPWGIDIPVSEQAIEPLRTINQTVSSSQCINDNKPRFFPSIKIVGVYEDADVGANIATVFANDSDAEENSIVLYSITRIIPNDVEFYINETTGDVFLGSSLDREINAEYSISVHAEDQGNFGSLGGDGELVVNVLDVNDNDPMFAQSLYDATPILESVVVGTPIITVLATDRDKNNNITYSLPDPQKFFIDRNTGEIIVDAELDYETVMTHMLLVLATDQGGREGSTTVVVTVEPVNDNLPMCPGLTRTIVFEDASVGTVFHTIVVSDADVGLIHRDLMFELTANSSEFALNKSGDTTVDVYTTSDTLSFDGSTEYPLQVLARDIDGNNCTAEIIVIVGEASTLDFQIFGAGFAIGVPVNNNLRGFDQTIGMFGNSFPRGNVTVTLSGEMASATYYRSPQAVASLDGILITSHLTYDSPYVRVVTQAKDSTLNVFSGAEVYITAQPFNDTTVDPIIGDSCQSDASGTCDARVKIPQSWFDDYANSSLQIFIVSGSIQSEISQVTLSPRPVLDVGNSQNLLVQFPSYDLFSGQSFPIKVGAPLGNDIIAFEVSLTGITSSADEMLSQENWQCGSSVRSSPNRLHFTCLRSERDNTDPPDVIFPGEKFFEITVGSSVSDITTIEATVHTVVSNSGPVISSDTPAVVIDHRGVEMSPGSILVREDRVLGYLAYAARAEVIIVGDGLLSIDAYAVKAFESGSTTTISLSSTEFSCSYESYDTFSDCADLLSRFSTVTTQGSEEAIIIFEDSSSNISFGLPLRVWYPTRIWYEVSDSVLNRVTGWLSSNCADYAYQQTKLRVYEQFSTGMRLSPALDVSRFDLSVTYNSSIINIADGTVRGISPGSTNVTIVATPTISFTGQYIEVVDEEIGPLTSYPVVFTELSVTLSQDTFDRTSSITATATGSQVFDKVGVEGQAATTVYFTDGSRYDPPAEYLSAVSMDESVATSAPSGVVQASGNGVTVVNIFWTPQECPTQIPLISTPVPISVTLPYPERLAVSSLTVLRDSKDVLISSVPTTAEFDISLVYSDGRSEDISDLESVVFFTSPALIVAYNNSVSDSITVTANDSYVDISGVVTFTYGDFTTNIDVSILDVEELQASLFPSPNDANVENGVSHIDLGQVGSTSYWQQAELVTVVVFSNGSTERIEGPSATHLGDSSGAIHVQLLNNIQVVPIAGSFGTDTIMTSSGLLQSNTVTVTVLDSVAQVERIELSIEEVDRTEFSYSTTIYFVDGTRINNGTGFSNEIGEPLLSYQLVPEDLGTVDVTEGTIRISRSHYSRAEFTASIGNISSTTSFAANLEPAIGEVDLGAAEGIPIPPIAVDETFSFDVRVNTGGSAIKALDIVLTYNTTALQLVSVSPLLGFSNVRSNSPIGEIQLTLIGVENTEEMSPTVATVSFNAVAEGLANIVSYRYILYGIGPDDVTIHDATVQVGSSTTFHATPDPMSRELYLPPTSSAASFANITADGEINIIDAYHSFYSAAFDNTYDDSNLDGLLNVRDAVYLTRVATALVPFLYESPVLREPIDTPSCLLTFEQNLFSYADVTLYSVISHPDIVTELNVSQPINDTLVYLDQSGSGVFTTKQTSSTNGERVFSLDLFTPIDIRGTPFGYSLVAMTVDEDGMTSPDRSVQFVGGSTSSYVGDIPHLTTPFSIGEENGFRPLVPFTLQTLRSDYCEFDGSTILVEVPENAAVGSTIYTVSAAATELGFPSRNEQYSKNGESDPGVFILLQDGSLVLNAALDFESNQSYVLNVSGVTSYGDGSTVSYSASLEIRVLDANDEAPTLTVLSEENSLLENTTRDTVVATFEAFDREAGLNGEFYFELDSSTDPLDQFELVQIENQATLSTKRLLDRETNETYNLVVLVIDRGIPPLNSSVEISITVLDINDNAPEFSQSTYDIEVPEEQTLWNYTIGVVDPDAAQNGAVSLYLDPADTPFEIDNNGVLALTNSLDRETLDSYEFTIRAEDGGDPSLSSEARVRVTVQDINDNSPVLTLESPEEPILVEEDSSRGSVVAQFVADDRDIGENGVVTFIILDDSVPFRIDPNTGLMTLIGDLDVDIRSEFNITVVAVDAGEIPRADTLELVLFVIEGQFISFDASEEGFLVGAYTKSSDNVYSQEVGYLVGQDIGSSVGVTGAINSDTEAQDVVEIPSTGATAATVKGALLQSEIQHSQKTVTAFVQAFDARDVIAEPTAIRVRVISESGIILEGSCTTSPDLGYCITTLDIPDSWFTSPSNIELNAYANLVTIQDNGISIGTATLHPSPAYNTQFSIDRVLLLPPAHDVFLGSSFNAEVYVVSPIEYETYNRIEFDVQSIQADIVSVSSDETWQCSKPILSKLISYGLLSYEPQVVNVWVT